MQLSRTTRVASRSPFPLPTRALGLGLACAGLLALAAPGLGRVPGAPAAAPAAGASIQDPAAALDAIADAWSRDRLPALVEETAAAVAAALADPTLATDPERRARLEVRLLLADAATEDLGEPQRWARALADVDVAGGDPALAPLRARVAWLRRTGLELEPLDAWSFVGPFDNERGRGMTRPTPAEREPATEVHEGKQRDVRWRELPPLGPSGQVRIGQLVHPADQVAVLARTYVRADAERDALLLLGGGDELRVWCNGAPLFEALGEHAAAPDAFTVPVHLHAGWNELHVKVGSQDGVPRFTARLVDEAGAPLRLETRAWAPDGVEPLAPENPGRRVKDPRLVPRPGAERHYAGREDAEALVARAILARDAGALPRKERPGAAEAAAALAAQPDRLLAALLVLDTMRTRGALDTEEDVNPWLQRVDATLAAHGDRARLLRLLAAHARDGQGIPTRALALLDRALEADPDALLVRLERARVLGDLNLDPLGRAELERLTAAGALDAWPSRGIDLAAAGVGPAEWCERSLERWAAAGYERARLRLERRRRELGGPVSAEQVLQDLARRLRDDPWSVADRRDAAETLITAGEPLEARRLLDEAIALCPHRPGLFAWRARAALFLGDEPAALADLERELELDLSADDERRLLETLRGRAGEATAEAGTGFHVRFQEPLEAVLARRADDAPLADANAPREVLLSRQVVDVGADGTARRYQRVVERVRNEVGVKELDRRVFRAFPGQEEVRVLTAQVRRADGTLEQARTGRTGGRGVLVIDLPPLEPGDVVDVEWRRDDLRPSFFGDYVGLDAPLDPYPALMVRESEVVVLRRPEVALTYHVTGGRELEAEVEVLPDGVEQRTWRLTELAPRRAELLEPPPEERLPRVQASTFQSWEDFGRWWWNLIRQEITVSPEMREKVAELVEGRETPLERLRAIYDFVVTDVRYNAWEFGVHGYQPYSAPVIFSRRFGDCKDKAILIKAMLSEVGIEAWPVIIRSEGRRHEEDLSLALVNHFNHCIAYVPEQEGIPEMYLDGTARLHPLEVLPDSDRGAQVVVVRESGAETERIPFAPAAVNRLEETTTIDLRGEETAHVTLERRPHGRWDPFERRTFTGSEEERAEAVERVLSGRFGALRGEATAEHSDYEDLTEPVVVRLEGELERVGRKTPRGVELPTTFDAEEFLSGIARESERTTDLLLDVPWSKVRELRYELPEGGRVLDTPPPVEVGSEDLVYRRTVEQEGSTLVIREHLELRTHRVPVERYDAFREVARQVDEAQRRTVEVEVGP